MLIDAIRGGFNESTLIQLLLMIPIILISLTFHEYCHGYAAFKCGDMTARNFGRLTLNPIKHLDVIGTIMMLVFGFGYAKPVPINPRNFNKPRRDICIVSAAGPLSNLFLAIVALLISYFSLALPVKFEMISVLSSNLFGVWQMFLTMFVYSNVTLFVFNLLPIPPLDGSRLLSTVLPTKASFWLSKHENYIMIGLLIALYFGLLDNVIFFFQDLVIGSMYKLLNLIPIL